MALPCALRTEAVTKCFDVRPVLEAITFEAPAGTFLALLGANGAGKTTLLHALAGLTTITRGRIWLFDQLLGRGSTALRQRIGMIGHQPMLYRELSASENLRFFGKLYGIADPDRRANDLLDRVGLSSRAADLAKTFSRGMVQRLAIARALMHEPDLILADEPFSGLDVPSTRSLEELLIDLHESGKTIVLTNHEIPQSLNLAQRVIVLRQGRIVADAPTAETTVAAIMREVSQR